MSKLKVKIDGELWEKGKLFIHGDTEPEAIINTKDNKGEILDRTLSDLIVIDKDYLPKENENG